MRSADADDADDDDDDGDENDDDDDDVDDKPNESITIPTEEEENSFISGIRSMFRAPLTVELPSDFFEKDFANLILLRGHFNSSCKIKLD